MLTLHERLEEYKRNLRKGFSKEEAFLDVQIKSKPSTYSSFRTYTYYNHLNPQKHNIYARVVEALSYIYEEKDKIRGIARIICKSANKLALSHDKPNTNVDFSRGKVGWKNHKRRTTMKFSRFLSRQFNGRFTDSELEKLQIGFQYDQEYKLKIVEGQEATNIYESIPELHNDKEIPGLSSCMTGNNSVYVAPHFNLNPDNLKLGLLYKDTELIARAKIWKNDDETWFIDRVYIRKSVPGLTVESAKKDIIGQFEHKEKLVSYYDITIKLPEGEYVPYLDHAKQYDRNGDKMRIHEYGDYTADTTDGSDSCHNYYCPCCSEMCDEDDLYTPNGESMCQNCFGEYCDTHTEIDGDWYDNDEVTYDEIDRQSILSENAVRLIDGRYTHQDNATSLSDLYYDSDSYVLSSETTKDEYGEDILIEDSVTINCKIFHKNNVPELELEEQNV